MERHRTFELARDGRAGRDRPPGEEIGLILDNPPVLIEGALGSGTRLTQRWSHGAVHDSLPHLLALPLDVTNEPEAREAAAAAVKRFGRIDVLLNNAGFGLLGAVEEATGEEVERLHRPNVFGLLSVTRAVLPQMRRQRSGHVLNRW
jgi:NAD(P)-dependent dehydrogenase (short-subunit alcohol dehydrogenase family)